MADIVDQVEEIAENVTYIRHMLEGDEFHEGLVSQVKSNTREIHSMKEAKANSTSMGNSLYNLAWAFFVVAIVVSVADRALLISDIRHILPVTSAQALTASVVLGICAKVMIAAAASIFVGKAVFKDVQ